MNKTKVNGFYNKDDSFESEFIFTKQVDNKNDGVKIPDSKYQKLWNTKGNKMMNIPIYRAKKIDSDEYAYGCLVIADDYETEEDEDQIVYFIMHKMENYRTNEVWDFVCNSRVDPTTLAISINNKDWFDVSELKNILNGSDKTKKREQKEKGHNYNETYYR